MKSSPWIVLWSLALVFCDSGLANWLPDTSSLQSVAQMNFINPIRNLFRGNEAEIQALPSTFDTLCSHENDVHPTGSCVNLATCMFSGGTAAPAIANDNCGPLEGVCCTHHVKCGDTMTSRVAFWESDEYPAMSAMSGGCTLTITPSRNVCYIRVEFLDTILTSPRAETCEGNTLTINGQVEGNSGVICGNLNQHKTFIKVNEGMTGVFRVYKDVVMHMDIQDELHKYKIKLTQIKCDQVKSSPIKISRRHSRTFGGIENVSDENEQFSVGEYEGEAEQNRSSPGTEGSSSATPSRVKRQVLHRHHGAKKIDTINEPKKDFSPQSIPNPNDTLALQNQQVLGEWTWLRNMVSSLPSLGNILDPQDSEAAVQPLKFDSLPSNCDPRNAALCLTSNGKVAKNIEALSLLSSRTTGSTATNPRIPVHSSSDTSFGSAKKENVLKQLLGENFSQNIGPDSKLSGSASPPLHSRLSELIRSQISTRGRPRPPLRVETTVNIEEPSSLDVRSPPPTTSEQSPQTVSNSKKIFVEPLESLNGSRYPIASSDQMHEEMNGRPHTYNTTYTEELATSTIHTKNATTDTNKSDTRSVPEGNSTVIAGLNAFVNRQRLYNHSALSLVSDIGHAFSAHARSGDRIFSKRSSENLKSEMPINISYYITNRTAVQRNVQGRGFISDYQLSSFNAQMKNFMRHRERIQIPNQETVSTMNDETRFPTGYSYLLDDYFAEAPEVIPNPSLHHQVPQRMPSPKLGTRDNLYSTRQVFNQNKKKGRKDSHAPTQQPSLLQNWLSTLSLSDLEKYSAVLRRDNIYSDTLITDDISLRELKESIDEETEARQAVGDGLSIPRRRPAYGNVVDDGFVVLVSPLEKPSNNDNNYDSTPPRGDLNALAQHVGKLAASNFIANLRQASSTGEAEENDPQSASQNPTVSSRKEKDTSFYGYIVLKNELGEHFFCSATLITPLHALTAASCVMRKGFETKNYKIHAVFNEDDLGDARYRTGASLFNNTNHVRVTQTMFHPMYKHDSLHFDLAVLQLEREMKDCNPVSIARPDTELMGEDITMLGHGARPTPALTFAAYERHLTYITGRYLHLAACNEFYEDSPTKSRIFRHDFIKPEMLCVLSSEGVQLCEGDQGGPVLVNFDDDRKSPRLVGIASGNDNNCIGVQRKNIGEFPDIAVRLTWPVVEFIEIATAEIFFDAS